MKVKILGYTYEIKYSPKKEDGGMEQAGRNYITRGIILVDPTMAKDQQCSTILHEAIESINYHLDINMPHSSIMIFEAALYQFIVENPHIFRKEKQNGSTNESSRRKNKTNAQ